MTSSDSPSTRSGWLAGVTKYHWLVVVIASAGWLFDCMDQRLFTMARESALRELLAHDPAALGRIETFLGLATGAMMVGWATGGIIFGMLSDKWGRVKTMVATLAIYAGFTGLCGTAQSWVDFTLYRFLVGLGVGGMFGAATTLVAESVPGRFRALALGSLQALSATGNLLGAWLSRTVPPGAENFLGSFSGWRVLFFLGIAPALLAVPIMTFLKEPEEWLRLKTARTRGDAVRRLGSPGEVFRHPRWRRHTLVGLGLGLSGMVGLWGIGFFAPELITTALKDRPLRPAEIRAPARLYAGLAEEETAAAIHLRQHLAPAALQELRARPKTEPADSTAATERLVVMLNGLIFSGSLHDATALREITLDRRTQALVRKVERTPTGPDVHFLNRQLLEQIFPGSLTPLQPAIDRVRSTAMMLFDVGSFAGMLLFTVCAAGLSRRGAFLLALLACLGLTGFVFTQLRTETDAYWMLPLMGCAQLAVFAGYSIYFPELYPTRLRGTGVGLCYNTVRYLAAPFPYMLGYLSATLSLRTAGLVMSTIYLLGLVVLWWAPETKGQPLPEDS